MTNKSTLLSFGELFTVTVGLKMIADDCLLYSRKPLMLKIRETDIRVRNTTPAQNEILRKVTDLKMMKNMMGSIQVTPTQETRNIAGYNCQKYLVSGGMMMNSDYWLSKDVKGYEEVKEIGKKISGVFDDNPMMKQMNIAGMMGQLDGFPVQTVMNIMQGTSTTTLKKIEKKSLDKSLFSVPEGYTLEQSKMPMMSN